MADEECRLEHVAAGVVRVVGEIDMSNADEIGSGLTRTALNGADGALSLDLSELRFIDSTGVHTLIRVAMANPGVCLRLGPMTPTVERILTICGLPRDGDGFKIGPFDSNGESKSVPEPDLARGPSL